MLCANSTSMDSKDLLIKENLERERERERNVNRLLLDNSWEMIINGGFIYLTAAGLGRWRRWTRRDTRTTDNCRADPFGASYHNNIVIKHQSMTISCTNQCVQEAAPVIDLPKSSVRNTQAQKYNIFILQPTGKKRRCNAGQGPITWSKTVLTLNTNVKCG